MNETVDTYTLRDDTGTIYFCAYGGGVVFALNKQQINILDALDKAELGWLPGEAIQGVHQAPLTASQQAALSREIYHLQEAGLIHQFNQMAFRLTDEGRHLIHRLKDEWTIGENDYLQTLTHPELSPPG